MSLSRPKFQDYESLAEALEAGASSLPRMGATTVRFAPLLLEVPLFSVARNTAGVNVDATWSKPGRGSVRYRGPALSQSHQTLLLTLVHVRAGQDVRNIIEFVPSELLTLMGWSANSRNIDRLAEMLNDLFEARLDLWGPSETAADALSVRFLADMHTPREKGAGWSVNLSERVLALFRGHLSNINVRKRAALREGLATFMYGYICANDGTVPMDYEALRQASGSETRLAAFKGKVHEALDTLKAAGCVNSYRVERGQVRVYH